MTEPQPATTCDCPAYPADLERDCCCVGGSECIDGVRRHPSEWDPPGPEDAS